jgi:thiosulfate/3-mercaptopyruvate sulfurtransferase
MTSDYARPELLASTEWLAEHLDDPSVRIVDCDEPAGYQRLHIGGAIGLRAHHYLKEKGGSASVPGVGVHVMGAEDFERTMSQHGISNHHTVVAYDNSGGVYAARLWWVLDLYGHGACRLLNGGFRSWYEEGRPVTQDQPSVQPATFRAASGSSDSLCTIDDVRSAIDDPDTVIWDVRSASEYAGEDRTRNNKRRGRIPGAVHLEWLDLTAPPRGSGVLLPADQIRAKLEALGITPEKKVLTH